MIATVTTNHTGYRLVGLVVILLTLSQIVGTEALAWTAEAIKAAHAVANGTATPLQERIAFKNRKQFGLMGLGGDRRMPPNVYQKFEAWFENKNQGFAQQATRQAGEKMVVQKRVPGKLISPGTDSDYITSSKTSKKSKFINNNYERIVENWMAEEGVSRPKGQTWRQATDTDLMGNAEKATPKEFEGIGKQANDAYKRPESAKLEAKLRDRYTANDVAKLKQQAKKAGKSTKNLPKVGQMKEVPTLDEYGAYGEDMQDLNTKKSIASKEKLNKLIEMKKNPKAHVKGTPEYRARLDLEGALHKKHAQQGKYIGRLDGTTANMREQHGLKPKIVAEEPKGSRDLPAEAAKRGRDTRNSAHAVNAMDDHLMDKALKRRTETLGEIGIKKGEFRGETQAEIARATKNMSPSQKGEVLETLRQEIQGQYADEVLGGQKGKLTAKARKQMADEYVKGVAEEMRKTTPDPKKAVPKPSESPLKPSSESGVAGASELAKIREKHGKSTPSLLDGGKSSVAPSEPQARMEGQGPQKHPAQKGLSSNIQRNPGQSPAQAGGNDLLATKQRPIPDTATGSNPQSPSQELATTKQRPLPKTSGRGQVPGRDIPIQGLEPESLAKGRTVSSELQKTLNETPGLELENLLGEQKHSGQSPNELMATKQRPISRTQTGAKSSPAPQGNRVNIADLEAQRLANKPVLTPEQAGVKLKGRLSQAESLAKTKVVKDPSLAKLAHPEGQTLAPVKGDPGLAKLGRGEGAYTPPGNRNIIPTVRQAIPQNAAGPEEVTNNGATRKPASLLEGGKSSSQYENTARAKLAQGAETAKSRLLSTAVGQKAQSALAKIQAMDQRLANKLGVTQTLPSTAGKLRRGLSAGVEKAGVAMAAGATAYHAFNPAYYSSKAAQFKKMAQDAKTPEDEQMFLDAAKGARDMEKISTEQGVGFVAEVAKWGAAGAVAPTATAAAGGAMMGYYGTRAALENTEKGKAIDKAVQDKMTESVEIADDLGRRMSGQQTVREQELTALDKRQDAWLRALDRGDITLQEGATEQDLLDMIEQQQDQGKTASLDQLGDMANVVARVEGANNDTLAPLPEDTPASFPALAPLPEDTPASFPALAPLPEDTPASFPALAPLPEDTPASFPALAPLPEDTPASFPAVASLPSDSDGKSMDELLADFPIDTDDTTFDGGDVTIEEQEFVDVFTDNSPTNFVTSAETPTVSQELPQDEITDLQGQVDRTRREQQTYDRTLTEARHEQNIREQENWKTTLSQAERDRDTQEVASRQRTQQTQRQGERQIEQAQRRETPIKSEQEMNRIQNEITSRTERETQRIQEEQQQKLEEMIQRQREEQAAGQRTGDPPYRSSQPESVDGPPESPNGGRSSGTQVARLPGAYPSQPPTQTPETQKPSNSDKCQRYLTAFKDYGKRFNTWLNSFRSASTDKARIHYGKQASSLANEATRLFDRTRKAGCAGELPADYQRMLEQAKQASKVKVASPPKKTPTPPRRSSSGGGKGKSAVCDNNVPAICTQGLFGMPDCYCADRSEVRWVY